MTENRKPFPLITPMITGQSAITHVACDHMVIYYTRCCDLIEFSLIVPNDLEFDQNTNVQRKRYYSPSTTITTNSTSSDYDLMTVSLNDTAEHDLFL